MENLCRKLGAAKVIIDMKEVNQNKLQDWPAEELRDMQKALSKNLDNHVGDEYEQLKMVRLMSIEIKRQIKIRNINLAAEKATEQLLKEMEHGNWLAKRQQIIHDKKICK